MTRSRRRCAPHSTQRRGDHLPDVILPLELRGLQPVNEPPVNRRIAVPTASELNPPVDGPLADPERLGGVGYRNAFADEVADGMLDLAGEADPWIQAAARSAWHDPEHIHPIN